MDLADLKAFRQVMGVAVAGGATLVVVSALAGAAWRVFQFVGGV